MNNTYFSALVALAGAAIGGLTPVLAAWVSQHFLLRHQASEAGRASREKLYMAFMEEAARLLADALAHQRDDVNTLVQLYVHVAHIRLVANAEVVAAAEAVADQVVATYQAPNRSLHDLPSYVREGGMEPLIKFSMLCRSEIRNL